MFACNAIYTHICMTIVVLQRLKPGKNEISNNNTNKCYKNSNAFEGWSGSLSCLLDLYFSFGYYYIFFTLYLCCCTRHFYTAFVQLFTHSVNHSYNQLFRRKFIFTTRATIHPVLEPAFRAHWKVHSFFNTNECMHTYIEKYFCM